MSFSSSIAPVAKSDFAGKVEDLTPSPPITSEAGQALFEEAKDAVLRISQLLEGPASHVVASISGHSYAGEEGSYPFNSVAVSVSEVTAPLV